MTSFLSSFTDTGKLILFNRYANSEDIINDNPDDTYLNICTRVCSVIKDETLRNEIYNLMSNKRFVPAGRTLTLCGTKQPLIPNCLVLSIEDSLIGIFDTLRRAAICQQSGMGLGFNFSSLRPCWESTHNGCKASGPISFMNMYSKTLKIIQQKSRGGANMGILNVDHPDILSFIHAKDDLSLLSNFNISVFITKEFMEKLRETPDELFVCTFNGKPFKPRRLIHDYEFVVTSINEVDITYRELWDEIIRGSWKSGEPGVVFDENINATNKAFPYLGKIDCTNPCSEVPLYANETCNLGSVNLERFCDEIDLNDAFWIDNDETDALKYVLGYVHVDKFESCVRNAVIFMNIVVDNLQIPDKDVATFVPILRRIGLGIMGLHDMLIKLKIPYGSKLSLALVEFIVKTLNEQSLCVSRELVKKYGSVAERLLKYRDSGLYKLDNIEQLMRDEYLNTHANIELTSIAPTGSISMIINTSSGIEPYFDLTYRRRISKQLIKDVVINKHLKQYLEKNNLMNSDNIEKIMEFGIKNCNFIDRRMKKVFKTSQRINVEKHIKMQASAQKNTGNAISKTCNLPNSSTTDDVYKTFMTAYENGCKGVTVYRDGARPLQVFATVNATSTSALEEGTTTEEINISTEVTKVLGRTCKNGTCEI
jgi:ribonucleoside-diphosphate reductase alpha chain